MRIDGIRDARRAARALLHRFGVRAAEHVAVESFARTLGAEVVELPLRGAKARLVRAGERARIELAEHVTDHCARRFSVAHELGHFVMRHPSVDVAALCSPGELRSTAREDHGARDPEAEANAFAGELLMPETLLRKRCEVSPVSLEIPSQIAREFQTSILASAIRFAELSSERCAAVFSHRGVVRWAAPSVTFIRAIERGRRVGPLSVAWQLFNGRVDEDGAQLVPADTWFDTSSDAEIVEHSITSREFGTVLTMLWVPEASAPRLGMAA